MVICRPAENSPNRIGSIYTGQQQLISAKQFGTRDEELEWVAESVANDVLVEKVRPEHVVVISLDARSARRYLSSLQRRLLQRGVDSTIPGLVDDSSEFAEEGRVTLSTVNRAKGNEAPVVYILSFEELLSYVDEVKNRNRAFTAISRAKGFVRISGTGKGMATSLDEIQAILRDIPCFRFMFPDMEKIARRLDASETSRRRKELRKAMESAEKLVDVDEAALAEIDPELLKKLRDVLKRIDDAP